jgi:hypothetical protein
MEDLQPGIAALGRWSLAARIPLGLFLAAAAILIVAYGLVLVAEFAGGLASPTLILVVGGANLLMLALFLVSAVFVPVWVYRAHANLRDAGLEELKYPPGWSAGSFFVPLVNFVVPFRAMRELHNRSHGEGPWQAEEPVADVSSWWACHVAAVVVFLAINAVLLINLIPGMFVIQPRGVNSAMMILTLLLLTGSALFLLRTIAAVTEAQRTMRHLDAARAFA